MNKITGASLQGWPSGKSPCQNLLFRESGKQADQAVCAEGAPVTWWGLGGHPGTPGCGLSFETLSASPRDHKTTLRSSHRLPTSEIKCAIKAQQAKGSLIMNRKNLETESRKKRNALYEEGRSLTLGMTWSIFSFSEEKMVWVNLMKDWRDLPAAPLHKKKKKKQEWSQTEVSWVANIVTWMWHGKLAWPQVAFKRLRLQRALSACTMHISCCQCRCLFLWSL